MVDRHQAADDRRLCDQAGRNSVSLAAAACTGPGMARLATLERNNLSTNSKLSGARVREFYQNEETVRIMLLHIGVDMSTFDYVWPDKLV